MKSHNQFQVCQLAGLCHCLTIIMTVSVTCLTMDEWHRCMTCVMSYQINICVWMASGDRIEGRAQITYCVICYQNAKRILLSVYLDSDVNNSDSNFGKLLFNWSIWCWREILLRHFIIKYEQLLFVIFILYINIYLLYYIFHKHVYKNYTFLRYESVWIQNGPRAFITLKV